MGLLLPNSALNQLKLNTVPQTISALCMPIYKLPIIEQGKLKPPGGCRCPWVMRPWVNLLLCRPCHHIDTPHLLLKRNCWPQRKRNVLPEYQLRKEQNQDQISWQQLEYLTDPMEHSLKKIRKQVQRWMFFPLFSSIWDFSGDDYYLLWIHNNPKCHPNSKQNRYNGWNELDGFKTSLKKSKMKGILQRCSLFLNVCQLY